MPRAKVVAIVGPTCTGKTALSLSLARKLPAEIICCDSRNVYKYFDIGSAKPTEEEQNSVAHHLISVAEPDENFTAAEFARLASKAIDEIRGRAKLPIVCGGTGFYARALLEGLSIPEVEPDEVLREKLKEEETEEPGSLHRKLAALDPISAAKLNPRDLFRLTRALEVCLKSGKAFSELAHRNESPYDVLWIGLSIRDRDKLKELISRRIKEQMQMGMLEETKDLLKRFGPSQKLMNTVNYRDLLRYLSGELSLDEAISEAEKHNYQLARRQIMWFKTNPQINWFFVDELKRSSIEESALALLKRFLSEEPGDGLRILTNE